LLRTYETGSAPIQCTIWEAARATSAAPTFFPPIQFSKHNGGEFIDAGVGCNNPTKILIKEAKSYCYLKGYIAIRPTCLVSIGTGQRDLVQLHRAASAFWFKDRTGLSIAPVLRDIATDCENTHDEVALSYLDDNAANVYYRFSVPQGLQQIVLDEWDKAREIRTYTDKYMRLNQTDHELLECVRRLQYTVQEHLQRGQLSQRTPDVSVQPQALTITQEGSTYGNVDMRGGSLIQGNVANFEQGLFRDKNSG
jgi:hypothetical protein